MVKVDYSALYLAALAALVLSCASSEGRPQSDRDRTIQMFLQHLETIRTFTCSEPQKRLVQLKDLDIAIRPEISYYPSATVLRRCDCATGYCGNSDDVCSADVTKEVELVFKIMNQVGGISEDYIKVNATEHISCSCQPITNQIK